MAPASSHRRWPRIILDSDSDDEASLDRPHHRPQLARQAQWRETGWVEDSEDERSSLDATNSSTESGEPRLPTSPSSSSVSTSLSNLLTPSTSTPPTAPQRKRRIVEDSDDERERLATATIKARAYPLPTASSSSSHPTVVISLSPLTASSGFLKAAVATSTASPDASKWFDERCLKIIEGLYTDNLSVTCPTTLQLLQSHDAAYWMRELKRHTRPKFFETLNRPNPPTPADLMKLPWVPTDRFGSYGCLLVPFDPVNHHYCLYDGSATGTHKLYGKLGLNQRRAVRSNKTLVRREGGFFHNLLLQKDIRHPHWFTMLICPDHLVGFEQGTIGELRQRRFLCRLGEAVYGIWLGVFADNRKRGKKTALFRLCPFNLSSLEWYGTCSHSPLVESLGTPIDSQLAKEGRSDPKLMKRRIISATEYQKKYIAAALKDPNRMPEWRRRSAERTRFCKQKKMVKALQDDPEALEAFWRRVKSRPYHYKMRSKQLEKCGEFRNIYLREHVDSANLDLSTPLQLTFILFDTNTTEEMYFWRHKKWLALQESLEALRLPRTNDTPPHFTLREQIDLVDKKQWSWANWFSPITTVRQTKQPTETVRQSANKGNVKPCKKPEAHWSSETEEWSTDSEPEVTSEEEFEWVEDESDVSVEESEFDDEEPGLGCQVLEVRASWTVGSKWNIIELIEDDSQNTICHAIHLFDRIPSEEPDS